MPTREELLAELRQKLKEKYEPAYRQLKAHQDERPRQTQEQIQAQIDELVQNNPKAAEMLRNGIAHIGWLHMHPIKWDDEQLVAQANREAEALLPFVEAIRLESRYEGPLTEAEYLQASLRKSQDSIETSMTMLRAKADGNPDDRRSQFARSLLNLIEQERPDYESLRQEDITEKELEEITKRINDRWLDFTNQLSKSRTEGEDES